MILLRRDVVLLTSVLGALSLAFSGSVLGQQAPSEARVEQFSPQGEVRAVRQVRAVFSDPMVAFGDPHAQAPFEVECPIEGSGRWEDTRNWIYDFEHDLSAGVRCTFRLKDHLRTQEGQALAGSSSFSFSTGGPSILQAEPYEGHTRIAEDQAFILQLSGEPDLETVRRQAAFVVEGLGEQVPLRLIEGEQREAILKSHWRFRDKTEDPEIVVVQARQVFSAEKRVTLLWDEGIESVNGVPTSQPQTLVYKTRPDFTAHLNCSRENARENCIPIEDLYLRFSAQVEWEKASQAELRGPSGKVWKPWRRQDDNDNLVSQLTFQAPFPPETDLTLHLPDDLRDDAGRLLVNASRFPLTVPIDSYPPLAKFAADFGILEWKADPVLPVTLRAVESELPGLRANPALPGRTLRLEPGRAESLISWLNRLQGNEWEMRKTSIFTDGDSTQSISLPKPHEAEDFEVVGIPLPEPGFYIVELQSEILGGALLDRPGPMYVRSAALVTDLAVHLKQGRENWMVWVTSLSQAQPVAEAEVSVWDCKGRRLASGRTDPRGLVFFEDPAAEIPRCGYEQYQRGLLVTASTGQDMGFVHTTWDQGIEPWRYGVPTSWRPEEPLKAHTVFGRTLLRAGETLHMKHLLRKRTMKAFEPHETRPKGLLLRHGGSGKEYQLPLSWSQDGIALNEWDIPRDVQLGFYQSYLIEKLGKETGQQWLSGSFRVEEYRVPLATADIRPPDGPLIAPDRLEFDLNVRYLAGGAASRLPVKFRYQLNRRGVSFDRFPGFNFASGPIEGQRLVAAEAGGWNGVQSRDTQLDEQGGARVMLEDFPAIQAPAQLRSELEFRDPAGETQTVSSSLPLWPTPQLVGLKMEGWHAEADNLAFVVGVADVDGEPQERAQVSVDLYQRVTYSIRKRLVGGFYSYDHHSENQLVKRGVCSGSTDVLGRLECQIEPAFSGTAVLEARLETPQGPSVTTNSVWISGQDDWWYEAADHDRIDLIPEQAHYEPGETARLHARTPFRRSTALVTLEREGVMQAWVRPLWAGDPVLEVPVCETCAPNVFVSALLVRPRVGNVQPTALVDLGKPSYRLGIAEIKVGWRRHRLQVNVRPEHEVYKVRENVPVEIEVRQGDGSLPPPGSEIAVAAVDEGLLELQANGSWDLLAAMMGRRSYEVSTATAQMQVVGKRHYGLKALPPGGGGGRNLTRELFDTLLFWDGQVKLDAQGRARVTIPLNDSLTTFRIAAVANDRLQRFGWGSATVRTTQDLMLFSGLPPVVREGDVFRAEFTVRNASERSLTTDLQLQIKDLDFNPPPPQSVELQPGQSKVLEWEVTVPVGRERLEYLLMASSADASDSLKVKQEVAPAVPVRVYQSSLTRADEPIRLSAQPPARSLPNRGGVEVRLSPTLLDGLEGVREYMSRYPYTCFEQMLSQAVALRDQDAYARLTEKLPIYMDGDGLIKYFPGPWQGSDVLTSYFVAITREAGWDIPQAHRQRIFEALRGFVEGRIIRGTGLPTADLSIRKLAAVAALSRHKQAQASLLESITLEPNLWPTSALLDWIEVLRRVPEVPEAGRRRPEALQILRSRLDFRGTAMGFSSEARDRLWWLMISPDLNAVRTLLTLMRSQDGAQWDDDMARLVRGVLQRRHRGHWDITPANAWGVLAIEDFARRFEDRPVSGQSRVRLDGLTQTIDWNARETSPQASTSPFVESESDIVLNQGWGSDPSPSPLQVEHSGGRPPWVTFTSRAAVPLANADFAGFRLSKSITPVEVKEQGRYSRGDVLRVRLEIEAQSDRTWVVVEDPIPAGSVVLGGGLGRDSALLTQGERDRGRAWKTFEERSFRHYRAYYGYFPKGTVTLEYTLRLNQAGTFDLPPTRTEAMYSPEMYGELPNTPWTVDP
ncbi:MAG TPA: alpha-2-macroglobulin family protein [Acidobacteriota bacterium]|nr:alpha-2-macroglobulin family protein [Acidobacteriota bacterium]